MATAKLETAASRYRRIKAQKAAKQTLHDVTCTDPDCGMVWRARRAKMDFWVTSGILPLHLVEQMSKVAGKNGQQPSPENLVRSMPTKQVIDSVVFASKVVRYTAVEPAIVDEPTKDNEISPEEVDTCCYNTLLNWQMQGGDEAAGLQDFRQG